MVLGDLGENWKEGLQTFEGGGCKDSLDYGDGFSHGSLSYTLYVQ
jgi:hypothetical protein